MEIEMEKDRCEEKEERGLERERQKGQRIK